MEKGLDLGAKPVLTAILPLKPRQRLSMNNQAALLSADEQNVLLAQLQRRRQFFACTLPKLAGADTRNDGKNLPNTCPGCGYPTLGERCGWEICGFCFWEDDGQDEPEADQVWGGPNGSNSLTSHRRAVWMLLKQLTEAPVSVDTAGLHLQQALQRLWQAEKQSLASNVLLPGFERELDNAARLLSQHRYRGSRKSWG